MNSKKKLFKSSTGLLVVSKQNRSVIFPEKELLRAYTTNTRNYFHNEICSLVNNPDNSIHELKERIRQLLSDKNSEDLIKHYLMLQQSLKNCYDYKKYISKV